MSSQGRKKHSFESIICFSVLIYLLIPYQQTIADTSTTNLQVSAMVQSRCIVKNGSLNFGLYDPVDANSDQPLQSVGQMDVQCVKQSSATLQLNNGNHAAYANGTSRAMKSVNGNSYLNYEIYTNSSSSSVWNTSNTVSYSAASASPTTINVYGKIPANQQVEEGAYSDSVMIIANF